jgi:hypothetical protein
MLENLYADQEILVWDRVDDIENENEIAPQHVMNPSLISERRPRTRRYGVVTNFPAQTGMNAVATCARGLVHVTDELDWKAHHMDLLSNIA